MELYIRAHDLKAKNETEICKKLDDFSLAGVQLVAYKCLDDVRYAPGAITKERAKKFSDIFSGYGKKVALIGAYFNPVHSNAEKVENGIKIFEDYLRLSNTFGCNIVGSETGSYNDDKWTYNPVNRTDEAFNRVVETFSRLTKVAYNYGAYVGIEGAFGHVMYDVDRLDFAVKKIGADNVKIIFDLYNYLDASNFSDRYEILSHGLKTFKDKICVFHLKDCVLKNGKLCQRKVGGGVFDYDRILETIARYDINAKLVFEGTAEEDVAFSVNYINQKIKSL